jgi:DNA-binding Lrp family transcriptional regulator
MDIIDKRIIIGLTANCRISYRQLGKSLGLSATSIQKRISKLKEKSALSKPYVMLTPDMFDAKYCLARIETNGSENDESFTTALSKNPQMMQIARLSSHGMYAAGMVGGPTGFQDFKEFIQGLSCVTKVETQILHMVTPSFLPVDQRHLKTRKKVAFTKPQKAVLSQLILDAGLPATEIAKQIPYSPRRVQQILLELQQSKGLQFTLYPKFSAAGVIPFWLHMTYKKKGINPEEIVKLHLERYPFEYWSAFLVGTKPVITHLFIAKDLQVVEDITAELREASYAEQVESEVIHPTKLFVGPGHISLAELLGIEVSNREIEYYNSSK